MIDCEFDVRAYEEGYRAGKHDAQVEIERLRAALRRVLDSGLLFGSTVMHDKIREQARAALGGEG